MEPQHEENTPILDLFTLVASITLFAVLFAQMAGLLPKESQEIVSTFLMALSAYFLGEFTYRLANAKDKKRFFKRHWIDLVSAIPILMFGRVARFVQILLVIRSIGPTIYITRELTKRKGVGFMAFFVAVIFVDLWGASTIYMLEKDAVGAQITNIWDALWWSSYTLTSVAYGEYFPITPEGRVVALLLQITGIGLFGSYSGLITLALLNRKKE